MLSSGNYEVDFQPSKWLPLPSKVALESQPQKKNNELGFHDRDLEMPRARSYSHLEKVIKSANDYK